MKATLEYNLPEEQDLYIGACQGVNIKNVVRDIDNEMRNWLKHGHSFKSADEALENKRTFGRCDKMLQRIENENLNILGSS